MFIYTVSNHGSLIGIAYSRNVIFRWSVHHAPLFVLADSTTTHCYSFEASGSPRNGFCLLRWSFFSTLVASLSLEVIDSPRSSHPALSTGSVHCASLLYLRCVTTGGPRNTGVHASILESLLAGFTTYAKWCLPADRFFVVWLTCSALFRSRLHPMPTILTSPDLSVVSVARPRRRPFYASLCTRDPHWTAFLRECVRCAHVVGGVLPCRYIWCSSAQRIYFILSVWHHAGPVAIWRGMSRRW